MPRIDWVLLAYRLPREPSTPRITTWRKLRRLGAIHVVDGLVALPADARTKEHLEWVAEDVLEAGGEATVFIARPGTSADERRLASAMAEVVAAEYRSVAAEAETVAQRRPLTARPRVLARLRRELERIDRRAYFATPERDIAHDAVRALAAALEGAPK